MPLSRELPIYGSDWDSELWANFLEARLALIGEWDDQLHLSPVTILGQLSMDLGQVVLLVHTARERRSARWKKDPASRRGIT